MLRLSLCLLLCVGCVADQREYVSDADSAGVRIVTVGPIESVSTVRVGPEPVIHIGTVDGPSEYTLSRVVGAQIVDSSIIVADGSSGEIRQFDQQGRFLRRAGSQGEGPGEFVMLRWMSTNDDSSVVAWDLRNRRFTYLTHNLDFARSAVLNPSAPYMPLHVLPDGALLVWPFGASPVPLKRESTVSGTAHVAVGWPGRETLDTLAATTARPSYVDRSGELWRLPFTVDPSFAVTIAGSVWVANGNDSELRRYSRTGDLELVVRLPASGSIVESDLEKWLASDPKHAAALKNIPVPHRYPSFNDIASNSDGSIWVAQYMSDQGSTRSWLVLDSTGLPKMRVIMPNGGLLDLRHNEVLLLERDSLGVERVAFYRIPKPAH